jgi:hypothetical protein
LSPRETLFDHATTVGMEWSANEIIRKFADNIRLPLGQL